MGHKKWLLSFFFENLLESFNNIVPTKCNNLSFIAKFYDPTGLIQPVIIKSKLLFQDVCVTHADWNRKISGLLKDKFDFIVKFVKILTAVKVSRCYFYDIMPRDYIVTLNCMGFRMLWRRLMGVVSIWNVWEKTIPF